MVIQQAATLHEIGRRFAEALRAEADVTGLWLRAMDGYVEAWLVSTPLDFAPYERLVGLAADVARSIPEPFVEVLLLNPSHYRPGTDMARDVVPHDAKRVA